MMTVKIWTPVVLHEVEVSASEKTVVRFHVFYLSYAM